MLIEFKYKIDQKIVTPFNKVGLISMLGFDESGVRYYVTTEKNSAWFKEGLLRPDTKKRGD